MDITKHIPHMSKSLKIGAVLFCFMCLFYAVNMASKFEHQKTQTEIYKKRVKELEEKIQEVSALNQELAQIHHIPAQGKKEQGSKEIDPLQEKNPVPGDWKLTIPQGIDSTPNTLSK
ncbi:MAG: hypothetical protein E3K32_12175 [wastewater metagenome]|nr:hypothetical protein [Candidatus Loosdrechtia aerotolerans]